MKTFVCLILTLALVSSGVAQISSVSSLQAMIDAERAFARMSVEQGTRAAFMAFIADDGILFRPKAVKGKQWMIDHPLPPSDKRSLLNWQPTVAFMSSSGDMGYTAGPWEFKDDINNAKPDAFGHFITVWKKQADGAWKFAVDLGVSHPEPTEPAQRLTSVLVKRSGKVELYRRKASAASMLLNPDAELSRASETQGAAKAFVRLAVDDVRVFRNNKFPFVGKNSAKEALSGNNYVWTWKPEFADISSSGDLGYSYGLYQLRNNDAAKSLVEQGNYLRIWKRQDGKWKVVMDVAEPIPAQ
jgi:ketosteroid isomerase-like protein